MSPVRERRRGLHFSLARRVVATGSCCWRRAEKAPAGASQLPFTLRCTAIGSWYRRHIPRVDCALLLSRLHVCMCVCRGDLRNFDTRRVFGGGCLRKKRGITPLCGDAYSGVSSTKGTTAESRIFGRHSRSTFAESAVAYFVEVLYLNWGSEGAAVPDYFHFSPHFSCCFTKRIP